MSLLSPFHRGARQPANRHSRATRVVAMAVLGLLCFQLSRVYLVIPADAFICNIPDHSHGAGMPDAHHHDHDADPAAEDSLEIAALATQDDGPTYIQHCKDTWDGLGLTPAQPFGLPVATSAPMPEMSVKVLPADIRSALENFLPPPFQPPRNIS